MPEGIDEMVDDALWDVRHGVWFSGPYRLWRSPERQDWCLWYCMGLSLGGRPTQSVMLKRGLDTVTQAKRQVEGHRELMRIRLQEKPLAT